MTEIKNTLYKIGNSYQTAKNETFTNHSLAKFIRQEAIENISEVIDFSGTNIFIKGSAGQGNWSDVPWIAFLDVIPGTPYGIIKIILGTVILGTIRLRV